HPQGSRAAPPPTLRRQTFANQAQDPCDRRAGSVFRSQPNVHSDLRRNPMSTAQDTTNKAMTKRFCDAANTGDAELIYKTIDERVEPGVLIHMPLPIEATGAQALKQVWAMLLRGLPDLHLTIEDLIEEGDKVVMRNTVTGTHQGEYM